MRPVADIRERANQTARQSSNDGPLPRAFHPGTLRFSVIDTIDGLEAIEAQWNALYDETAKNTHFFQSFNWIWHWCRAFTEDTRDNRSNLDLRIVIASQEDRLVLVFPMVGQTIAGTHILSWLGDPVSQYGDVIIDPAFETQDVMFQAWQFITTYLRPDLLVFRKVRDDATVMAPLRRLGARVLDRMAAPYLDLTDADSGDAYKARYSAKARKNRRRHRKRLAAIGEIESHLHEPGPDAAHVVARALTLKRQWLANRNLASRALSDRRTDQFFLAIAGGQERPVPGSIMSLTVDGETAAIDVVFRANGRMLNHVSAYAARFERHSPGSLAFEHLIDHAVTSGVTTLDLMAPADTYKEQWSDYAVGVYDFIMPITVRGHAHDRLYFSGLRKGAAILAKNAPRPIRRIISPLATALSRK